MTLQFDINLLAVKDVADRKDDMETEYKELQQKVKEDIAAWNVAYEAVVQFDNFNIYMTYDAAPDKVIILRKKVLEELKKRMKQ